MGEGETQPEELSYFEMTHGTSEAEWRAAGKKAAEKHQAGQKLRDATKEDQKKQYEKLTLWQRLIYKLRKAARKTSPGR